MVDTGGQVGWPIAPHARNLVVRSVHWMTLPQELPQEIPVDAVARDALRVLAHRFAETLNRGDVDLFDTFVADD